MSEVVLQVGMAELKSGVAPGKIVTLGLGSCVGVCIYDLARKIGGMAHVMLPSSLIARESFNPAKFADTAIPSLVSELEQLGVKREQLTVKIAGGAHMFSFKREDNFLDIGSRNVQAVEEICLKLKLPIIAKNVGGNTGRSITLDLDSGLVQVKTINQGISVL